MISNLSTTLSVFFASFTTISSHWYVEVEEEEAEADLKAASRASEGRFIVNSLFE
jgi:hypothetical protein